MTEGWARYAELAREIDAVRVREQARTAGLHQATAEMSQHADELEARLNGQRGMLQNLAKELRIRVPDFTPSMPGGEVDPATSLAQVAGAIDRGDAAARSAAERGQYAGFLPGLSAASRSLVIYGIAALAVLLIQIPKWMGLVDTKKSPAPSFIGTMILLPGLAFGIAYAVLTFGTRTRVATARERVRARMGFLMCFGIGPLGLLVFFVVNWQQNLPK